MAGCVGGGAVWLMWRRNTRSEGDGLGCLGEVAGFCRCEADVASIDPDRVFGLWEEAENTWAEPGVGVFTRWQG